VLFYEWYDDYEEYWRASHTRSEDVDNLLVVKKEREASRPYAHRIRYRNIQGPFKLCDLDITATLNEETRSIQL